MKKAKGNFAFFLIAPQISTKLSRIPRPFYYYIKNFPSIFLLFKVDADYTSQGCCKCGHTSRDNRPNKGLIFLCKVCGFELHADLLGARNIALRTLVSRQDWEATGRISTVPDVSDKEAKAERLLRLSELRWSLDTIPDF